VAEPRDPSGDLRRIAFLLEAASEPTFRVRAFRSTAATVAGLDPVDLAERVRRGTLRDLPGIGEVMARTVAESLRGEEPVYLRRLEATGGRPVAEAGAELLILLFLLATERKARPFAGRTFWSYMFLYAVSRYIIEIYRGDPRGELLGFSTSQFISLVLAPLSLIMLAWLARSTPPAPQTQRNRRRVAA